MELITSVGSNIGILLILLVAHRAGLLKVLLNGKNGSSVETQIKAMQENHLHALQEGIDDIKMCQKDIKNILANLEKYGIHCRRKDE
jgi:hypothetical protein